MNGSFYLMLISLILSGMAGAAEVPPVIVPTLIGEESDDVELPTPDRTMESVQESRHNCTENSCDCSDGWGLFGPLRSWWYHSAKPRLQESHWGYREYFHERPFGTLMRANMQEQVINGLVDQMVLYEYDFTSGSGEHAAELNSRGRSQLRRLALMTEQTGTPIVIEKTQDNEQLDRLRRQFVIDQLVSLNVAVSPDVVVSGRVRVAGIGAVGERHLTNQSRWNITYKNRLLEVDSRGSQRLLPDIGRN